MGMNRIPLLLLPGLLCDERLWRAQIADLADITVCHVADLSQDDRLEAMAARALAAMPERFAVAALSMGGYVAFSLLRLAPERVSRLALFDTSARPDTEISARRRRGLMALAGTGRFRGIGPRLFPQLVHPDRRGDRLLAAEVVGMAERMGRAAFLRQQTALLHRPDFRGDLGGIQVQTLVVVGEADQLTPLDRAEEIARGIAGARLVVMPGCGHLPPMEQPDAVSALLREWLSP